MSATPITLSSHTRNRRIRYRFRSSYRSGNTSGSASPHLSILSNEQIQKGRHEDTSGITFVGTVDLKSRHLNKGKIDTPMESGLMESGSQESLQKTVFPVTEDTRLEAES
ncbi:MAG: hypothetical protein ACHQUC_07535 [Chlamydiales bacterium]